MSPATKNEKITSYKELAGDVKAVIPVKRGLTRVPLKGALEKVQSLISA